MIADFDNGIGFQKIARVQKKQIFARGMGDTLVHGMIYAAVFFGALVGDVGLVFVDNLPAVVDAASVYDKVFDREAIVLVDDALYGAFQPLSIIVINGDDGNFHER